MNERGNRWVAVIDDDESVCRSLANLLASLNYRVKTFASAEAFLLSARRVDTACLVLDLRMAGMGGIDLLKSQAVDGLEVPTIVLTGDESDEARDECLRSGAIAFLRKPCNAAVLCATVKAAMRRSTYVSTV
jgi:FixJ family two-component response regulator